MAANWKRKVILCYSWQPRHIVLYGCQLTGFTKLFGWRGKEGTWQNGCFYLGWFRYMEAVVKAPSHKSVAKDVGK